MSGRLAQPPDPLFTLARDQRPRRALVRGQILGVLPRGARSLSLPYDGLDRAIRSSFGPAEPVLARIDVEEAPPAFERPMLARLERGRDFYLSDDSGRGLVRVSSDDSFRIHQDLELHVDGAVRTFDLGRGESGDRTAWVRLLRVGDPVVVVGPVTVEEDGSGMGAGGFRELPRIPVLRGDQGTLHIYDEAAFAQAAAWDRLSWLGKLAVLLRSPSR